MGNMKANRKFVEGDEAVSAVIGVILMVAITVAIAATVYVYVTGIVPQTSSSTENAGVTVTSTSDDRIKVLLGSAGQNMPDAGYNSSNNVAVFINGSAPAGNVFDGIGETWTVGESITIGLDSSAITYEGSTSLVAATYDVTVTILDSVVFDGSVKIS